MNNASVQDQQIIRDMGEDFRQRVRKAIRAFETIIGPVKYNLKEMITEMVKTFVPMDEQIQSQLINASYYVNVISFQRYISRYEDNFFRIIMKSLNYIHDPSHMVEYNQDMNYKYIAVIFCEQIRDQVKDDKKLSRLWDRLIAVKKEKEKDEGEEGFWDAQEETVVDSRGQVRRGVKSKQDDENECCFTKKDMNQKEILIRSLQSKLQHRETNLVQITGGYLKELQILREQLFRKETIGIDYKDSYDVSYFDFTEVLEPSIRNLLQGYISDLKLQFEKRTIDYLKVISNQTQEISNLRFRLQRLIDSSNVKETPLQILERLFKAEENPYKIWKLLQDLKGNFYFREVFESQKAIYGINYQEINQLMMTSKAYEREFQVYKEQIQQEMQIFFERCLKEVESYKIQSIQLEQQLIRTQQDAEMQKTQLYSQILNILDQRQKEELNLIKIQNNDRLQKIENETLKLDQVKMKCFFKVWRIASCRMDIKLLTSDRTSNLQKEIQDLQEQINLQKRINSDLVFQLQDIRQIYSSKEKEFNQQLLYSNDMKIQFQTLQTILRQTESQKLIVESVCQRIMKLIDPKLSNLKPVDLNLEDRSRESTKSFINSIKNLTIQMTRTIKEVKQQNQLNQQAYNAFLDTGFISREVQTDIQDVNVEMGVNLTKSMAEIPENDPQSKTQTNSRLSISTQQKELKANNTNSKVISINSNKNDQSDGKRREKTEQKSDQKTEHIKQYTKASSKLDVKIKPNRKKISESLPQSPQPRQSLKPLDDSQIQKLSNMKDSIRFREDNSIQNLDPQIFQSRIPALNTNQIITSQPQKQQEEHKQSQVEFKLDKLHKHYPPKSPIKESQQEMKSVVDSIKQPFKRLYQDSIDKAKRIEELKCNLELMEKSHWEDIIDLFSQLSVNNTSRLSFSKAPSLKQEDFNYKETQSFRAQCYKEYYIKVKSKTPNQDRKRTWQAKKTEQIDSLINQTDMLGTQFYAKNPQYLSFTQELDPKKIKNRLKSRI